MAMNAKALRIARALYRVLFKRETISRDPVVRVNEGRPAGCRRKLAWNAPVAGISFRRDAAESFIEGNGQKLLLEREPDNPVGETAIKVIGTWRDWRGDEYREQLGYVPGLISHDIALEAPDRPLFAALQLMFRPSPGKGPGLRMNIWTTACPRPTRPR